MRLGRCLSRSAGSGQGQLVGSVRGVLGRRPTFLIFCCSSASRELGEPSLEVDRRAVVGTVLSQAPRHPRLPGQEDETGVRQQEARGPTGRQRQRCGEGQEEKEGGIKGRRKGRGGEDFRADLTPQSMNQTGKGRGAVGTCQDGDPDEALHVPGANAPVCDVLRFWSPMARWMLRTVGPLSSFFRSVIGRSPSTSEGSASSLWPIPARYLKWFLAGKQLHSGQHVYKKMCRQKAVNYVVIVLSWLHLNRPGVAPACLSLQANLNKQQWAVVHRLERQLMELVNTDAVGPETMGHTAAKVESLDSTLEILHAQAQQLLPELQEVSR